ncbi:MAG: SHOCT domain-containing protein [Bacteroidales bacterium]|nr:SHOCT domain-containing protein [Bacteroidales bacterium]
MGGFGNGPGFGMGGGWIIGLIIIALISWLVVRLTTHNPSPATANRGSALDVLKKRYAKGEIDKQEFEEKKKDLM